MASSNLDLVRSIYAAWERGDYSSVEWAHPDIEWERPDGPEPGRWRLADVAQGWRQALSAWQGFRITAVEFRELDAGRVLVLTKYTGKGRSSGIDLGAVQAEGASLFHIRDGKVTRQVFYWDRERALSDLGLPGPAPSEPPRSDELPIREACAAIARLDAEALVAMCDPEIEFESRITWLEDATYCGHEGARRYIVNLSEAFEHIELEPSDLFVEASRAVFTNRFRARGRGSGVEIEQLFYAAGTARDGRFLWWGFFDSRAEALAAIGLGDAPGQPAQASERDERGASSGAVAEAGAPDNGASSRTVAEAGAPHTYALGHSERELDRLQVQARLIEPITRRFLGEAGLLPGMRVLDVGSGVGDVAFLAAQLVGAHGEVVGVDRSGDALAIATERARQSSLANVSFRQGDPARMSFEDDFDAVIGRYVLMFQPDPTRMLRGVAAQVRPGGLVAFHEPEWACARSSPPVASWDRVCELVVAAMTAKGADMQMGMKLHSTFIAGGLPAPTLRYESVIGAGASSSDQVRYTTDVAVTLLADMEELGLIAPAEIDAATLAERVLEDVAASGSVIVGRSEIGAWARVRA